MQNNIKQNSQPPLIAHVIHRLAIGGLENGLVNLINRIPEDRYRHAIVCMTDYSDFSQRIRRKNVEIYAINKKPGHDPSAFFRLFKLFRHIQPTIVHSRNLSGLDGLLPAILTGVPCRIHGEHGRDIDDLDGSNRKQQWVRRLHKPMVDVYVSLSKDLESYLREKIKVPEQRIRQIYNGVDTERFCPTANQRNIPPRENFGEQGTVIIGTVGRIQPVKDQITLAKAFVHLVQANPDLRSRIRLMIVGDGPLREQVQACLEEGEVADLAWLTGARDDVAELLRCMDIFVLPSLAEGISNTLLESMACGLPTVATDVGGNKELVSKGNTGFLVQAADPTSMAEALLRYINDQTLRHEHGENGRKRVEQLFSLDGMVQRYLSLYDEALQRKGFTTDT